MANETAEDQQKPQRQPPMKGYTRRGLVSEKVLLEKLPAMRLDESGDNPVITLSSVEGDLDMEEENEEPEKKELPRRTTLKTSLSLDVPTLSLEHEAKRPPI